MFLRAVGSRLWSSLAGLMARVLALALLLVARTSTAAIYESPIDIDTEDDIAGMEQRGEISADTAATLNELFSDGVDLNDADRDQLYELPGLSYADVDAILEYRKQKGRIDDPAELVGAGAITDKQLLQIAPFLLLVPRPDQIPLQGKAKLISSVSSTDTVAPPVHLRADLRLPLNLKAGFEVTTTRFRPPAAYWDATLDRLTTSRPGYAVYVPRVYAAWKAAQRQVIVGSFRVGFGERLVLDNTKRKTPYGFNVTTSAFQSIRPELTSPCRFSTGDGPDPCPDDGTISESTRDYRWNESFRGVAGSVEDIELGTGGPKLSLYGFGSLQTHSVYQYQLFDKQSCQDPNGTGPECSAPQVWLKDPNPDTGAFDRLSYSTLPSVFHELAVGAHARLDPSPRWRLGLTGYFAHPFFNIPRLDFQDYARFPWNGSFGAVGLNGRVVLGPIDVYGEFARSFDSIPTGPRGGFGGIVRGVWSPKKHQVEFSLRYYDNTFGNPYARPIAAPDMLDGQRARNEAGARLTYDGRVLGDLWLGGWLDFWVLPFADEKGNRAGMPSLWARARATYKGFDFIEPGAWFTYRNKDLAYDVPLDSAGQPIRDSAGNPLRCYSEPFSSTQDTSTDPADEPRCVGDQYRTAVFLHVRPFRRIVSFWLQGQQTWQASKDWPNGMQVDRRIALEVRSEPWGRYLNLRVRGTYTFIDVYRLETETEQELWINAEIAGRPWGWLRAALRYDLVLYTDQRPGTLAMNPNPQHSFRLVVDAKF